MYRDRAFVLVWAFVATCVFVIQGSVMSKDAIQLPPVIGDKMVLQADMPVPVWGKAAPGEKVTVGFAGQTKSTTADKAGKWRVQLDALPASSEPKTMNITTEGSSVAVRDVLVGEVWFFSGQSNAAMRVKGTETARKSIAAANLPNIRFFTSNPDPKASSSWVKSSPETAGEFSGVGYYFARALHRDEKVPVGMIVCARGGTMSQTWISPEGLAGHPQLKRDILDAWERDTKPERLSALLGEEWKKLLKKSDGDAAKAVDAAVNCHGTEPSINFRNYGIADIAPFAVRGFGWYQGESNAWGFSIAERYREELKLLVQDWRRLWGGDPKPFLVVQLPQYPHEKIPAHPYQINPWCLVMESQWLIRKDLPNVHTAVTIDLGEHNDIHPRKKAPIGERLSLLARKHALSREIPEYGPVFREMKIEGNRIRLRFDHIHGGLVAREGTLSGFTIAGEDRCFEWAKAEIDGDSIICWHDGIKKPVAVRYAMTERTNFTLYNKADLPAGPFRTDDWPIDLASKGAREAVATRANSAPALEAKPDSPVWSAASPVHGMTLFHSYRSASNKTEARFVWDDEALYAAIECQQKKSTIRAKANGKDPGVIWSDDNIQILLDVNHDKKTYFRIAVNPEGSIVDGVGFNDWRNEGRLILMSILKAQRDFRSPANIRCRAAHRVTDSAWHVVVAIPWSGLGLDRAPAPGTKMGLQITRTCAGNNERSEWAVTGRDCNTGAMMPYFANKGQRLYHGVGRFGTLVLK